MDELDVLLQDLSPSVRGSTATAASARPSTRPSTGGAGQFDELSALMNELGPGASRQSAAPAAAAASRGTTVNVAATPGGRREISSVTSQEMNRSMEDLDSLMNSLNTDGGGRASMAPGNRANAAPAAAPRGSNARVQTQNFDDLDALMAGLNTSPQQAAQQQQRDLQQQQPRGSVAPAAARDRGATTSSRASEMNDLDALMNNLSAAPTSKPAAAPAANRGTAAARSTAGYNTDDLDSIMSSLQSVSGSASRPVSMAPQPAGGSRATKGADDLDSLMASIEAGNAGPSRPVSMAPKAAAKPAPAAAKPRASAAPDDLDSLMASLEPAAPAKKAAPAAASPAKKPAAPAARASAAPDDLDSLMASLEQPAARKPAPAAAAAPVKKAAAPRASAAPDDLDSLMASLDQGPAKPAARPPPPNRAPPAAADDLDSLMAGLGAAGAAKPVGRGAQPPVANNRKPAAAKGEDALANLMGNLASQIDAPAGGDGASKGVCAVCRKDILGEVVQACGKLYHVDHFVCKNCQDPIGEKPYFELDRAPHCERCYQGMFCPKCAHCDEPIADKCITAIGKKWHVNHFICTQCLQPFPRGVFFESDGKPYCEADFYELASPKCAGCNKPIRGDCVNAMGQQWHHEHFACTFCGKVFAGEPFYEHGGKPFCEQHYHQQSGAQCGGCGKSIVGRCVSALNKKWHPEHFTCGFCMNPLAGGAYSERGGKPYCKTCFSKLFS